MNWVEELESVIFDAVKRATYDGLSEKYPDIYYTSVEATDESAQFPTCYIHLLPMVEEARDMDSGSEINAVNATFQIEVSTNTTKADARDIIYTLGDCFKSMQFGLTSMPEFTKEFDVHRAVMRARRNIGSSDILNLNV